MSDPTHEAFAPSSECVEPKRVTSVMFQLFLIIFSLFVTHSQAENEVYFSLIISRGEHGYNSSGVIPAIDIALEMIEQSQLLRNYSLTYVTAQNSKVGRLLYSISSFSRFVPVNDLSLLLQCARTDSLDVFFKDIQNINEPKIAVVGCGCSVATEAVAEISHHWNISQV